MCNGLFFLTPKAAIGEKTHLDLHNQMQKEQVPKIFSQIVVKNGDFHPMGSQSVNKSPTITNPGPPLIEPNHLKPHFSQLFRGIRNTFRFDNLPLFEFFTIGTGGCSSGFCFQAVHTSLPMRANVAP